jgi:hypothetical protein
MNATVDICLGCRFSAAPEETKNNLSAAGVEVLGRTPRCGQSLYLEMLQERIPRKRLNAISPYR